MVWEKDDYWVYFGHPTYKFSGRAFESLGEAKKWSKEFLERQDEYPPVEETIIFKKVAKVLREVI